MSDVTDAVISGELERKFPESYKLFNNFRLDNTSLDNILDKINNGGIESLDKVDRLILKKSQKI